MQTPHLHLHFHKATVVYHSLNATDLWVLVSILKTDLFKEMIIYVDFCLWSEVLISERRYWRAGSEDINNWAQPKTFWLMKTFHSSPLHIITDMQKTNLNFILHFCQFECLRISVDYGLVFYIPCLGESGTIVVENKSPLVARRMEHDNAGAGDRIISKDMTNSF